MTQAERIIDKFGGLTRMARALGHKHPTTVQGWRKRGYIPPRHHAEIIERGQALGLEVEPVDFLTVPANYAPAPQQEPAG